LKENSNNKEIQTFMNDFGFFLYMNLSKIQNNSNKEKDSDTELNGILATSRKPLINGENFAEIIQNNNYLKNPKLLSALFSQVEAMIDYIKPRIEKFVEKSNTKDIWLGKMKKFKEDIKILNNK
jgi:hypothetical protein